MRLLYVNKRLTCLYRALRFTIDHRPSTIDHPPSTIHHPPSTIDHRPSTIDYDGRSALLEVATMGSTCGRTATSVSSR